jgi:hypothetical protein
MVDADLALPRLRAFLQLVDSSHLEQVGIYASSTDPEKSDQIKRQLPLIRKIVADVEPGAETNMVPHSRVSGGWPFRNIRDAVLKAIGALETEAEAQAILGPKGPRLAASQFHPWVWSAAVTLWDQGQRRLAVQTAATTLETHLGGKLGIPRGGKDLFGLAFSDKEPTVDEPRLRFPEFPAGSNDYTSALDGARFFGMGCMARIRNLATHRVEEIDEQVALEQLAALSLLARWVESAEVVRSA